MSNAWPKDNLLTLEKASLIFILFLLYYYLTAEFGNFAYHGCSFFHKKFANLLDITDSLTIFFFKNHIYYLRSLLSSLGRYLYKQRLLWILYKGEPNFETLRASFLVKIRLSWTMDAIEFAKIIIWIKMR